MKICAGPLSQVDTLATGEAEQSCWMLNPSTLQSDAITLLLLVHCYQWPTHCPEQLVGTEIEMEMGQRVC